MDTKKKNHTNKYVQCHGNNQITRIYKINDMKIIQIDLLNWLEENISKKLLFQEIPKKFIKTNFELMISICLFKKSFDSFSTNNWIQFLFIFNLQESHLHSLF